MLIVILLHGPSFSRFHPHFKIGLQKTKKNFLLIGTDKYWQESVVVSATPLHFSFYALEFDLNANSLDMLLSNYMMVFKKEKKMGNNFVKFDNL